MLPQAKSTPQSWQSELRNAVRSEEELANLIGLSAEQLFPGGAVATDFPLLVPRPYIARMRLGDPKDPLLRQIVPDNRENTAVDGFTEDPLRESEFASEGVVRKYAGRTLVITTAACPVHCRYCFRRSFPYAENNAAAAHWDRTIDELEATAGTSEVILSGGDPLSLSDAALSKLLSRIASIKQVETVRIHTRFPIMIPARVTDELTRLLQDTPLRTVIVLHTNHPQEIDSEVDSACHRLRQCADALLNQSVLLRGVNADVTTLAALSHRLWRAGVLPYYLHMLDPVNGTAHFDIDDTTGRKLIDTLRARLPGYLVPRLVREIPGQLSKTALI